MNLWRAFIPGVLCFLAFCPRGAAQTRQAIDVSKLGPQVGERVPDFSLNDQTGKTRTMGSLMGAKGVMLVFFRSADW